MTRETGEDRREAATAAPSGRPDGTSVPALQGLLAVQGSVLPETKIARARCVHVRERSPHAQGMRHHRRGKAMAAPSAYRALAPDSARDMDVLPLSPSLEGC